MALMVTAKRRNQEGIHLPGVVFQLNEAAPEKHQMVLRNIAHVMHEMPDLVVELVVHGGGLPLVVTEQSTLKEELARMQEQGVQVAVCQNTMRAQSLTEDDLLPGMTTVRAGIAEIIRRQQEGFSYVRP